MSSDNPLLSTYSDWLNDLVSQKPVARGLYYRRKTIPMDGYRFVECRFDACVLHINSNEFEIERCVISPDTKILYGPGVVRPIKMFVTYGRLGGSYPAFAGTIGPDGEVTIK